MSATHDPNLQVNLAFGPPPVAEAGFGTALLIDAASDLTPNLIRVYENNAQAVADADLSVFAKAALAAMFAQTPAPAQIKVCYAATTPVAAFNAAVLADPNFYVVLSASRVDADNVTLAQAVEAGGRRVCWLQSSSADWLTGSVPAAFTAIANADRVVVTYCNQNAKPAAEAAAAARYVFDPDLTSQGFEGQVRGSVGLDAPGITPTQRTALIGNNANVILPFGPVNTYFSPGRTLSGRPVSEVLAGDWLRARSEETFQRTKLAADARGEMIAVDEEGLAILVDAIEGNISRGVAIGKFKPDQLVVNAPPPTQGDVDAQRLRATVYTTTRTPAVLFQVTLNVTRQDVIGGP
jgi:hypothetical protein